MTPPVSAARTAAHTAINEIEHLKCIYRQADGPRWVDCKPHLEKLRESLQLARDSLRDPDPGDGLVATWLRFVARQAVKLEESWEAYPQKSVGKDMWLLDCDPLESFAGMGIAGGRIFAFSYPERASTFAAILRLAESHPALERLRDLADGIADSQPGSDVEAGSLILTAILRCETVIDDRLDKIVIDAFASAPTDAIRNSSILRRLLEEWPPITLAGCEGSSLNDLVDSLSKQSGTGTMHTEGRPNASSWSDGRLKEAQGNDAFLTMRDFAAQLDAAFPMGPKREWIRGRVTDWLQEQTTKDKHGQFLGGGIILPPRDGDAWSLLAQSAALALVHDEWFNGPKFFPELPDHREIEDREASDAALLREVLPIFARNRLGVGNPAEWILELRAMLRNVEAAWTANTVIMTGTATRDELIGQNEVNQTSHGFLGGQDLCKALAVEAKKHNAFLLKLGRARKDLGDQNWIEAANPRPNSPKYLYRPDADIIIELAKAYLPE